MGGTFSLSSTIQDQLRTIVPQSCKDNKFCHVYEPEPSQFNNFGQKRCREVGQTISLKYKNGKSEEYCKLNDVYSCGLYLYRCPEIINGTSTCIKNGHCKIQCNNGFEFENADTPFAYNPNKDVSYYNPKYHNTSCVKSNAISRRQLHKQSKTAKPRDLYTGHIYDAEMLPLWQR